MKMPYYQMLEELRGSMEGYFFNFPKHKCEIASEITRLAIPELEKISGEYVLNSILSVSHSWNYDPQRNLYIDLTSDQFSKINPRILVTEETDKRFRRTEKNTPNPFEEETHNNANIFLIKFKSLHGIKV